LGIYFQIYVLILNEDPPLAPMVIFPQIRFKSTMGAMAGVKTTLQRQRMQCMCGRFVGFSSLEQIQTHFGVDQVNSPDLKVNFNIAPQQQLAVIIQQDSQRTLELMHWGLVPFWAKDTAMGSRMINARLETAASKPSFKTAFRKRRCLIINDGFFEWTGPKGRKIPLYIKPVGIRGPFAFGGLWETWRPKAGQDRPPYKSCTILTTSASASIRPIHHRMPVMLLPEAYDRWLDPAQTDPDRLHHLLHQHHIRHFKSRPVSKAVNNAGNNSPALIQPVTDPEKETVPKQKGLPM
jgi:putative SOS response-associated peptidase YedK